jgi:hypothetical protein
MERDPNPGVGGVLPEGLGSGRGGIEDNAVVDGLGGTAATTSRTALISFGVRTARKSTSRVGRRVPNAARSMPPLRTRRSRYDERERRARKPSSAYNWRSSDVGRRPARASVRRPRYRSPASEACVGRLLTEGSSTPRATQLRSWGSSRPTRGVCSGPRQAAAAMPGGPRRRDPRPPGDGAGMRRRCIVPGSTDRSGQRRRQRSPPDPVRRWPRRSGATGRALLPSAGADGAATPHRCDPGSGR